MAAANLQKIEPSPSVNDSIIFFLNQFYLVLHPILEVFFIYKYQYPTSQSSTPVNH